MKILVTGVAGFIGFHLALRLIDRGDDVVGLDNINDYYDENLKFVRIGRLGIEKKSVEWDQVIPSKKYENFAFIRTNLEDRTTLEKLFEDYYFDKVVNLAAQAGVRHSLAHPHDYIKSNIEGFLNILECCRHHTVPHLIYASSSSVYGLNEQRPLSENQITSHPISLYAATKKSNELMAHTYSYLFDLPTTGLRFFTVYGPWGRPDMALFLFTESIIHSRKINVYNFGNMVRDFTYIDDIIEGIVLSMSRVPAKNEAYDAVHPDPGYSKAPFRIYNIGNGNPVKLMDFIEAIEDELGMKADKNFMDLQPGDVKITISDISSMENDFGYQPKTSVREGIKKFIQWYKEYYLI